MRASSLAMLALPAVLAIPPQLREQVRGKEDELSAPAVKPMGDLARLQHQCICTYSRLRYFAPPGSRALSS